MRYIIKLLVVFTAITIISCEKEIIEPPKPLEAKLFLHQETKVVKVPKNNKKQKRKLIKKIFARKK